MEFKLQSYAKFYYEVAQLLHFCAKQYTHNFENKEEATQNFFSCACNGAMPHTMRTKKVVAKQLRRETERKREKLDKNPFKNE